MKRLGTYLGALGLLACGSVCAEPPSADAADSLWLNLKSAPPGGTSQNGSMSRTDVQDRMNDDGLPAHWIRPSVPLRVTPQPEKRQPDPLARSHLLDDVRFRSDGDLADQFAREYDDFGRGLSRRLLGPERGENVRFKRVDDGVGISIDFD